MGGEVAALRTSGQRPCGSGQSPAESSSWGAAPNRDKVPGGGYGDDIATTRFPEVVVDATRGHLKFKVPRGGRETTLRQLRFPEVVVEATTVA